MFRNLGQDFIQQRLFLPWMQYTPWVLYIGKITDVVCGFECLFGCLIWVGVHNISKAIVFMVCEHEHNEYKPSNYVLIMDMQIVEISYLNLKK